ncbi:hypothetical protein MTO96_023208 [Rhipicephalus appendiculatus]
MPAPNFSSHFKVQAQENPPAKLLVHAKPSASANLPAQNLSVHGNHPVPTKLPKPANLSAPNLPAGINIPTTMNLLSPEELPASANMQGRCIPERENPPAFATLPKSAPQPPGANGTTPVPRTCWHPKRFRRQRACNH